MFRVLKTVNLLLPQPVCSLCQGWPGLGCCGLGLDSGCRLGPGLFRVSLMLLGPAGYLARVHLVLMAKAQEAMLSLTGTSQAAACGIPAKLPLDKASHMGKAEVRG